MYTSGTGGTPRGVMLPHRAMLANRDGVAALAERLHLDGTVYLSFLPLSHSYEHTVGVFLLPSLGVEVVYSRGADRIAAEFQEFQPSIVTTVPRLFEVLRTRMLAQLEKEAPFKQKLFRRALALGLKRADRLPLSAWERLQDAVLDRLVRDKVRARFGGRLQALVSGGARLDPDLSGFFIGLGLPLIQGYGQTEAGPVIAVNPPWDNLRQTVGYPLPGVEARLAADGELLVRGALVMDGYWGNPEATAAAIRPAEGDPRARRPGCIPATSPASRRRARMRGGSPSPTASGTSSRPSAATW
ncbi:AMP-binding protein [Paeniroseomonas aquatica]|uniref:AMP-binding protein n=1 Tax=Paeniroseomonas aquatica TaxID=373043 RepID=UPI003619533C